MDYKFTFEDGSASLMHYGKKGMKWRHHKRAETGDGQQDYNDKTRAYATDLAKWGWNNEVRKSSSRMPLVRHVLNYLGGASEENTRNRGRARRAASQKRKNGFSKIKKYLYSGR